MNSFLYLAKTKLKNRIKKALKRPVTYIFIAFVIFYILLVGNSFGTIIEETGVNHPSAYAVIISVLLFYLLPGNFISYSKRKGLLFRNCDVHFMFPAPLNPKYILLFAGWKNLVVNIVLALLMLAFGLTHFHVPILHMVLYTILFLVIESIVETSMMILCYGNETLPNWIFKVLTVICYVLMALFFVVAAGMLYTKGFSFSVIQEFVTHPLIMGIPVIGWNVAMVQLIMVGPNVWNIVFTILFCLFTVIVAICAVKAKCEGEYFEDAATFADNYEKVRNRQKEGQMTFSMNRKKKIKEAEVTYKGTYAKALFYRQLLEYKKSRFFIFGFFTVVSIIVGIGIPILTMLDPDMTYASGRIFIIPGVMAYIIFIFSGYSTKWAMELKNPYTFLIPDTPFKKLWYSTLIEHIRALIDGCIMTIPGAIALGLNPLQAILCILFYICLNANKLYYYMVTDIYVGRVLGSAARIVVKLLLQGLMIFIAMITAVIAGIVFGITAGFFVLVVVTFALTAIGALIASVSFEKMEVTE